MSHYRFCPLSGNWVIISAKRKRRPSDFVLSSFENENTDSPFVYGNEHKTPREIFSIRAEGGDTNSPDWQVRVVPNKYNALDIEKDPKNIRLGLYDTMDGFGAHEVIVDTPRFPSSIYDFSESEMGFFLKAIIARYSDLCRDLRIKYILPFKNNGMFSGATISHSHTQIIAMQFLPQSIEGELIRCKRYFADHSRSLLEDIVQEELSVDSRIVDKSENFIAFCPFASSHSFCVTIMPIFQRSEFSELDQVEIQELSLMLGLVVKKLGIATDLASFNMLFHLKPPSREDEKERNLYHMLDEYYGWRIEIVPRISFDGGLEVASGIRINATPPEECAEFLRNIKDPE